MSTLEFWLIADPRKHLLYTLSANSVGIHRTFLTGGSLGMLSRYPTFWQCPFSRSNSFEQLLALGPGEEFLSFRVIVLVVGVSSVEGFAGPFWKFP